MMASKQQTIGARFIKTLTERTAKKTKGKKPRKTAMTRKRWSLLTLSALLGTMGLICALVITIDPFQVYRLATRFMPPIDRHTQVYSNAGIVRSYDYDSAIVGTSVTENFRPRQMDELFGGRFIKLCTSAGTAYNHALLLRLAFKTHEMRRIVYGIDVYSMIADLDETGSNTPLYLYDDNLFNDVRYWLNRSVLGVFLPRSLRAWGQRQDDTLRDSMYRWADEDDEYGNAALYNAIFTPPKTRVAPDAYLELADANLKTHIIPFVETNPETKFDFFFPPYSAAEWSNMESNGTLDALLALRGLCFDRLNGYENVSIYDFSARADWVTDLSNYKDTLHYGAWINDEIATCIANRNGIVCDREALDAASEQLRQWGRALVEAGGWFF